MTQSAVTVSLVEEARGGPFVYWEGLEHAFKRASALGYDAVEIFAPGPDAVDRNELRGLIAKNKVSVAAVGTGAGMVKSGLSLTDNDEGKRSAACDFVRQMIDFGAEFAAPAIIGSMQGRWGPEIDKESAIGFLANALNELGDYAASKQVVLIYEPLNRYETNLVNTISDGVELLNSIESQNVRLLADLFHMNIEEVNLADAIRQGGEKIGHVHFVDSNRKAVGFGHTDFEPVVSALQEIGFDGYISVEAFPLPDSETTASQTINKYKHWFA